MLEVVCVRCGQRVVSLSHEWYPILFWHDLVGSRRWRRRSVAKRAAAELVAVVGGAPPAQIWSLGYDAGRIYVAMHKVVVRLDLGEVDSVAEPGGLEQVTGIGPERRHLRQQVAVGLEVAVVDGVESRERREQPHVGLGDGVADEEALGRQAFVEDVELCEQAVVGPVVGFLAARESAAVHAVVHLGEHRRIDLVDLIAQLFGVEQWGAVACEAGPLRGEV